MNSEHLKQFILETEILSPQELEHIEDYILEKNVDFWEAVVQNNMLSPNVLQKILATSMGVSRVSLEKRAIPLSTFSLIPEPISSEHDIVCFYHEGNEAHVAFCDIAALEVVDQYIPKNIKVTFFLAEKGEMLLKKDQYKKLVAEHTLFKGEVNLQKISHLHNWAMESEDEMPENFRSDIANDVYTEKFVTGVLEYAVQNQAEYIFFNTHEEKVDISARIFDRNYSFLEIDKSTFFSILLKLKQLADIDIFEKFTIKKSSWQQEVLGKLETLSVTFVQTDFGESVTLMREGEKKFLADTQVLTIQQREMLRACQKKDSGWVVLAGADEHKVKETLYSFVEFDGEKNKQVYLLEKNILYVMPYARQIEVKNAKSITALLPQILDNGTDVISLDMLSKGLMPSLFNYVSTSKKVISSHKQEHGAFLDSLLEQEFDSGMMVKNFSLYIDHVDFKDIASQTRKVYHLKNDEIKLIKQFLSEQEVAEVFSRQNLNTQQQGKNIERKQKNIAKIDFHTAQEGKKSTIFSRRTRGPDTQKQFFLKGVLHLGFFVENCLLKRYSREKTKNSFRKAVKKAVLANALLASQRGQIDIKEVLQYLTK